MVRSPAPSIRMFMRLDGVFGRAVPVQFLRRMFVVVFFIAL
ncbi:MAG: hypothetical protein ACLQNE_19255 [Thermoguttaceae bacterium]